VSATRYDSAFRIDNELLQKLMSIFTVETMTTYEAAESIGVHHTAVRQFIQNGKLPAKRFGKVYVLAKSDVERFKADRERRMYR